MIIMADSERVSDRVQLTIIINVLKKLELDIIDLNVISSLYDKPADNIYQVRRKQFPLKSVMR